MIVLLNGPMGCGKSELVKAICEKYNTAMITCKDKLHELTMNTFNVDEDFYWDVYEDRNKKEVPREEFAVLRAAAWDLHNVIGDPSIVDQDRKFLVDGYHMQRLSIREAMIYVSECLIKPTFGEDYFGKCRAETVAEYTDELIVDDSCGFEEELPPLLKMFDSNDVLLIRIKGRGEFSEKDSRGYIGDGVVDNTVDVWNTGTEEEFQQKCLETIQKFEESRSV